MDTLCFFLSEVRGMKRYSELILLPTLEERFNYLKIQDGIIGDATFGGYRYLNQGFYTSHEWKVFRNYIITRDCGCDMAFPGREIYGKILIHHINPITKEDLLEARDCLMDPENVVCVSNQTHNLIHYGGKDTAMFEEYKPRTPDDTCLWKKGV